MAANDKDKVRNALPLGNANKLKRTSVFLIDELGEEELAMMVDELYSNNYLTREEKSRVTHRYYTFHDHFRCLLEILMKKLKDEDNKGVSTLFNIILKCLRDKCLCSKLAASLEENADSEPWINPEVEGLLDLAGDRAVDERTLARIMDNVGSNWEPVALILGIRNVDIENAKANNPTDIREQRFKVFLSWKRLEGFQTGGLSKLLRTFIDNFDSCQVDWKEVREILKKLK